MATNYSYTLSLINKVTTPLRQISGASVHVTSKIEGLISLQNKHQAVNHSLGGSLASLRVKLDMLRNEKEFISPANFKQVGAYNREIERLTKKIEKLDNVGKGSNMFSNMNTVAII